MLMLMMMQMMPIGIEGRPRRVTWHCKKNEKGADDDDGDDGDDGDGGVGGVGGGGNDEAP